MPQPFIETLPLQIISLETLRRVIPCGPRAVPSAPPVWRTVSWDRQDDRARAALRWSPTGGATGRCRACHGRPCRVRRNRGPCRAGLGRDRPCCGRPCCDRICRDGCRCRDRGPCLRNARAGDDPDRSPGASRQALRLLLKALRLLLKELRRHWRVRPRGACGTRCCCGGHDGGAAARAAHPRRPRRLRLPVRLPAGGLDDAGGCGRDADGARPNGRRAARLRSSTGSAGVFGFGFRCSSFNRCSFACGNRLCRGFRRARGFGWRPVPRALSATGASAAAGSAAASTGVSTGAALARFDRRRSRQQALRSLRARA